MKLQRKNVMLVLLTVVMLCVVLGIQSIRGITLSTRAVGVQVGQWAEYDLFADGNATGFDPTNIPAHAKMTVTGISSTNVTLQSLEDFTNGTQITSAGIIDVESGQGNETGTIIAANLNAGDPVYNGSWSYMGAIINETITRNYLGSNMETNHMNLTQQYTIPQGSVSMSLNYFWFRGSGILAEVVVNVTVVQGAIETWEYEHVTITGTNVPEFPVNMILPLFAVLSTLAAVGAKKRLSKNSI